MFCSDQKLLPVPCKQNSSICFLLLSYTPAPRLNINLAQFQLLPNDIVYNVLNNPFVIQVLHSKMQPTVTCRMWAPHVPCNERVIQWSHILSSRTFPSLLFSLSSSTRRNMFQNNKKPLMFSPEKQLNLSITSRSCMTNCLISGLWCSSAPVLRQHRLFLDNGNSFTFHKH